MLKIWKMAADFRNVYRYNVSLCLSVVLADVSEHNSNSAGENELHFVVGTCVFLLLAWFGIPACFRLSYIVGKMWMLIAGFSDEMWMRQQPKEEIVVFFSKNKQFSKPSDKSLARQEVQPPCFLLTWYEPRPRPSGIWKFRSNDTVQSISFP